ncbi:MAG: hypothetical protein ACRCUT_11500 [Spirochaetota bacterium]
MRNGSLSRRDVHTTHDLSDRDSLRITKDLEPLDFMTAAMKGSFRAGFEKSFSAMHPASR